MNAIIIGAPIILTLDMTDGHPLFVFDHIPKTAGTTFRRSYLIAAFSRDERWILSGGSSNADDIERFLRLPEERRRRIRIVAGHQAENLRERFPAARFLTVVRDPIERITSSYLHALFHEGSEGLWPDVREQQMDLRRFALKYEVPNMQSARLLGSGTFTEGEMRERLRSRYALVGCTEAFDQFVFMLHIREQFPLCFYNNRLVRRERETYTPSVSDLAFLRDLHAQDMTLHCVVRAEFQRQVDDLSAGSRARMATYLQGLERFRRESGGDPAQSVRLDPDADWTI